TTNAITIDNGAAVLTSTSGNTEANATGGISLLAGASGSARMATTNGNISATASDLLVLTGSDSFAQMTVGNAANTVTISAPGVTMTGGSGTGAFAEISAVGGLISIDGAGPISLTGGTTTTSPAQIINRTNIPAGDAISIGSTMQPTTLTLQGGLAADGAPA